MTTTLIERAVTLRTEARPVVVERVQNRTVVMGQQGPQGIQGIQGPAGATEITLAAGQILSGHRFVVPDASGNAIYADNTVLTHATKVIGMTLGAAVLGASVTIQNSGEHTEPSWSWTLDTPIYLSTTGLMTQTPPTVGFSMIVAFPVTSTKIVIGMRSPILLN